MICLQLFLVFLEIGAFTFGGGYAMLPLVEEQVLKHGWLDMEEIIDFIAVSESTPGPFAVNMATYAGREAGGIFGAFCATFGVVLPSFVIVLIVAKCFARFRNSRIVKGCMSGLKPAVIGLIGAALLSTGATVFFPDGFSMENISMPGLVVPAAIFILMFLLALKKVHPILIIILSAALGILAGSSLAICG